jgi:hypothetical protein
MGSSNVSCFASNQTISRNMACRVIPLLQNCSFNAAVVRFGDASSEHYGVSRSGAISAHDYWNPCSDFLSAVYDDYGQVKLDMTPRNREVLGAWLLTLYRKTGLVEKGKYSSEPEVNLQETMERIAPGYMALNRDKKWFEEGEAPEDGSLDAEMRAVFEFVWETARIQRMFVKDSCQAVRSLQFGIMHEVTYQELVSLASAGKDYDGVPLHAEAYVAKCVAKARETARTDEDPDNILYHALHSIPNRYDDEGLGGFRPGKTFKMALRAIIKGEISDEEFVKRVAPLLEGRYAYRGLNLLNLRFVPVSLCGQDYSNYFGEAYAKFVSKVSLEVTRANIVEMFGPLVLYSLSLPAALAASAQDAGQELARRVREYDGRALIHAVVPMADTLRVTLECTLDTEIFQELLRDSEDTRDFAESVVLLK